MKITNVVAACVLPLLMLGCATICGAREETVELRSSPPGARVVVREPGGATVFEGTTPTQATLKKKDGYFSSKEYSAEFTKPGYDSRTLPIETSVSGWYWGNLVFGGLIGFVGVDPATGAMWTFDDEVIDAPLVLPQATALAP